MTAPLNTAGSGAGLVFDGSGHRVTVLNQPAWTGFFNVPATVRNLSMDSSGSVLGTEPLVYGGWLFAPNLTGGVAINCSNSGPIGDVDTNVGGGIFGPYSTGTATNCVNTGAIGYSSGGIFGPGCTGTATNCSSTATIGTNGGGIFGSNCLGTATNCYSTGSISYFGGGIFGLFSEGSATSCYSTGNMLNDAGGIFSRTQSGTATNCYSTGSIGYQAGGIFGFLTQGGAATNCYSTGSIEDGAGGIFGPGVTFCTATHCYSTGTILSGGSAIFGTGSTDSSETFSGHSNGWFDTSANLYLTGIPGSSPPVWYSRGLNIPYVLTPTPTTTTTTTTTTIAPTPFSVVATSVELGVVRIHWTRVPGAFLYSVSPSMLSRVSTVSTTVIYYHLTPGSTYTFTVTAKRRNGTTILTGYTTPFTLPTLPGTPGSLAATPGTASATVRWTVPSNGGSPLTGYTLTVRGGGFLYRIQPTVSLTASVGTLLTTVVTGLQSGIVYTVSAFATNALGNGVSTGTVSFLPL